MEDFCENNDKLSGSVISQSTVRLYTLREISCAMKTVYSVPWSHTKLFTAMYVTRREERCIAETAFNSEARAFL
jgi:hypothetical protein